MVGNSAEMGAAVVAWPAAPASPSALDGRGGSTDLVNGVDPFAADADRCADDHCAAGLTSSKNGEEAPLAPSTLGLARPSQPAGSAPQRRVAAGRARHPRLAAC